MGQQGCPVLPNYFITDQLNKTELYNDIKIRAHLKKFIPNGSSWGDVPDDFMKLTRCQISLNTILRKVLYQEC